MPESSLAEFPVTEKSPSFWQSVGQSLSGAHHDYTALRLNRAVLLLAIPMVLEMVMESLFALSDVFWVSRLGKEAVAVVGLTESVMTIIYALAVGIAIAATAFISRRVGEKDTAGAAVAAGQILLIGLAFSIVLGFGLAWFAPETLQLMGASPAIVSYGTPFARIMFGSNITIFLTFLISAIFRGAGDAVLCMCSLWLANALNIVLGPCFIFGWLFFPQLGVTGGAVATTIGRSAGVLYLLWHLTGHRSRIEMHLRHLLPNGAVILSLLRMAGSGIVQMTISMASWIVLVKIVALFGNAALAGYTIAMRMVIFALLPAIGLANAGATLVGQNLGAGKPERAEAAVWLATRYNTWFLGFFGIIFVAFSSPIMRLFSSDPEVIQHGARALWIIGLGFPLYATGMCMAAAFNGAGDTRTPTMLNFGCFWVCEIPLAYLLSKHLGFGSSGVFISIAVAFTLGAAWGILLFRRGKWKLQCI